MPDFPSSILSCFSDFRRDEDAASLIEAEHSKNDDENLSKPSPLPDGAA